MTDLTSLLELSFSQSSKHIPLRSNVKNLHEFTFVLLRYSLGGDRPNQTTSHKLSKILSKIKNLGWYYTSALRLPPILYKIFNFAT
jgi:hypothetical protein